MIHTAEAVVNPTKLIKIYLIFVPSTHTLHIFLALSKTHTVNTHTVSTHTANTHTDGAFIGLWLSIWLFLKALLCHSSKVFNNLTSRVLARGSFHAISVCVQVCVRVWVYIACVWAFIQCEFNALRVQLCIRNQLQQPAKDPVPSTVPLTQFNVCKKNSHFHIHFHTGFPRKSIAFASSCWSSFACLP